MKRTIDKTLGAFTKKDLQTFKNIILTIKNDGWEVNDVLQYVKTMKVSRMPTQKTDALTEEQKKYLQNKYAKLCPECSRPTSLFGVPEGNSKGYKSVWRCTKGWKCVSCNKQDRFDETDPKDICGYEKFSKKTVSSYMDKYNKELNKKIEESKDGKSI